ncbi:MAG: 16S rRNA (cytidine(1402)-2'-O)-methyltransferase [Comamonadaceae bacterium CG1_02_60_18]|nr:MAG: 16S rRNA (cytidine(1402)-2'-O)-methyltransferase [Comamonadaceae bacterium CG1_02_60_18]
MTLSPSARLAGTFATALQAAEDAASAQDYPAGALYVVATPIGNLADITLRALYVLQRVDWIACEDTRHTHALLRSYGIDKSAAQLLALHQHNEAQASVSVLARLQLGARVAYVSDAGTPAVSDPGARLVAAAAQAGVRVVPLPGASSVTTVLSVAGLATHLAAAQGFVFAGFLSSKPSERAASIQTLVSQERAVVMLEAPHRIEALAQALAPLGARLLTVGRELTKQFEEIVTLAAGDFVPWLAGNSHRTRGEFALVLHPAEQTAPSVVPPRVLQLLMGELPLKTAVKLAAEITGQPRNALYQQALTLQAQSP